jgi:hypothetical protein
MLLSQVLTVVLLGMACQDTLDNIEFYKKHDESHDTEELQANLTRKCLDFM